MFPPHIATKQKCNIQQFYSDSTWNKPVGVSHVYILAISIGGDGNGVDTGGGSSAVCVWYGAAQNVPDTLNISVGLGGSGNNTVVRYLGSGSTFVPLITVNRGNGITAGAGTAANYFIASGFFTSTAGQAGSASDPGASATTFLSGGSGTGDIKTTANYGYKTKGNGYFQFQPVIVGVGGAIGDGDGKGGIGCGGAYNNSGGNGFVLIASW